jgi:peptidyl-tRNA hydrolase, PTH1 family
VFLIAGLGNPGLRYENTRHNIGFMVIERWAEVLGIRLSGRAFSARSGRGRLGEREIILLCPQTYMNESGRSVRSCAGFYRIETENILAVHDDLDIELGRIKVVKNGGGGGHKGVLSMFQHLGSQAFNRVKIGVGRPRYDEPVDEFVLRPFYRDEERIVEKVLKGAVHACELFVSRGIVQAMNIINPQDFADKEE